MSDSSITRLPLSSLTVHPAAADVPEMRADEWEAFLADVKERGIQEPITIQKGGSVLDGRHRLKAARERGDKTIAVRELNLSASDQADYALKSALHRRHLTDVQRSFLGVKVKEKLAEEADKRMKAGKKIDPVVNCPQGSSGKARDHAAAVVNVSATSIDRAEKVIKHGSPELIAAAKAGTVPLSTAAKATALPKPVQAAAVATGKQAVREAVKAEGQRSPAANSSHNGNGSGHGNSHHPPADKPATSAVPVPSMPAKSRKDRAARLKGKDSSCKDIIECIEEVQGYVSAIAKKIEETGGRFSTHEFDLADSLKRLQFAKKILSQVRAAVKGA